MDIKDKYNSWAATQYKEKVRISVNYRAVTPLTSKHPLSAVERRVQRSPRALGAVRSTPCLPFRTRRHV